MKQFIFKSLEIQEEDIKDRSSVTFTQDSDRAYPTDTYTEEKGVRSFVKDERVSEEEWINLRDEKGVKTP